MLTFSGPPEDETFSYTHAKGARRSSLEHRAPCTKSLLGDALDLGRRQLHRGLAAEDGYQALHLAGLWVDLGNGGGDCGQRAGQDGHGLAHLEIVRVLLGHFLLRHSHNLLALCLVRGSIALGGRRLVRHEELSHVAGLDRGGVALVAHEGGHAWGFADDGPSGVIEFGADEDAENPFGFRDAIAQPNIAGSGVDPLPGDGPAIAAGEFILGENSETGQPLGVPQPPELGRNGTYVVLRKYNSRVGAFNDFLREHAESEEAQHLLAAKMVGRWRSGAPLILSPDHDDEALGADPERNNDFTFRDDPKGLLCPYSSHIRRLNPRDSSMTILTDVNIKRIIRRPSTFGPKWTSDVTAADDGKDARGLFFIFISARAYDTIEFLQQEWINRGNFIDLGEELDPIVGLHEEPGTFTIPDEPARRRVNGVTTFNRLRGGEYMFMPSISALKWIAKGEWVGS